MSPCRAEECGSHSSSDTPDPELEDLSPPTLTPGASAHILTFSPRSPRLPGGPCMRENDNELRESGGTRGQMAQGAGVDWKAPGNGRDKGPESRHGEAEGSRGCGDTPRAQRAQARG